jgi:hypothetical protein
MKKPKKLTERERKSRQREICAQKLADAYYWTIKNSENLVEIKVVVRLAFDIGWQRARRSR